MVSVYHICSLLLLLLPTLNQDSKIRKRGQIKGDSLFGWGFYRCSHPGSSWRESATFFLLLQLTWEENLDIRGQWQRLQTIAYLNPGSACKRKPTGAPVTLKVCWAADKFISTCHTAGALGATSPCTNRLLNGGDSTRLPSKLLKNLLQAGKWCRMCLIPVDEK